MLKKKKNVDSALEAVEEEMDNFQMKKQDALNKVDVCLTLQMHQVLELGWSSKVFCHHVPFPLVINLLALSDRVLARRSCS